MLLGTAPQQNSVKMLQKLFVRTVPDRGRWTVTTVTIDSLLTQSLPPVYTK